MKECYRIIWATLLAAMLAAGTLAQAAPRAGTCPPGHCCCAKADHRLPPTAVGKVAHLPSKGCPCQITPSDPLQTLPPFAFNQPLQVWAPASNAPVDAQSPLPSPAAHKESAFGHAGDPPPHVPLYLQNHTFLC